MGDANEDLLGHPAREKQEMEDWLKWAAGSGTTSGSDIFDMKCCSAEKEIIAIAAFCDGNPKTEPFAADFDCPNLYLNKKEYKGKKGKWDVGKMRTVRVYPEP